MFDLKKIVCSRNNKVTLQGQGNILRCCFVLFFPHSLPRPIHRTSYREWKIPAGLFLDCCFFSKSKHLKRWTARGEKQSLRIIGRKEGELGWDTKKRGQRLDWVRSNSWSDLGGAHALIVTNLRAGYKPALWEGGCIMCFGRLVPGTWGSAPDKGSETSSMCGSWNESFWVNADGDCGHSDGA